MKFLDVEKVGTDSFKMIAKMKGDPYLVHNFGSTGSTGSISSPVTKTSGSLNAAQEDNLTIDLGSASLHAGDKISLQIEGHTISYTAKAHEATKDGNSSKSGEITMANGIAAKINSHAIIKDRVRAYSSGSTVIIHSEVRGTGFNANNPTRVLQSANHLTASLNLSNKIPNQVGTKKVSVKIGPDDDSAGGGEIAIGDVYRLRIKEEHPDEINRKYNFRSGTQTYQVTVSTADMTHDAIKTRFINQINTRNPSSNGSYNAVAGTGVGEIIISERNAGDTFSVTKSVFSGDSLTKTQLVPNVSPFSIESSMNFLSDMLSQNGAEQSRLNVAHENLENHYIFNEQANGRISHADTAQEATRIAKELIKNEFSNSCYVKCFKNHRPFNSSDN